MSHHHDDAASADGALAPLHQVDVSPLLAEPAGSSAEIPAFSVSSDSDGEVLRADVHVLTLTATPIPRTLQMALAGVRELSLIATPPVDRLAVRTFVTPFDAVTIREALLREQYRGGQSFYVCPRIEDLAAVAEQLREAGVAPIVHMQPVGDDELVERDGLLLVPFLHHFEPREDADAADLGDTVEQVDHAARVFGALVDARRVLRVDQHQIGVRTGCDASLGRPQPPGPRGRLGAPAHVIHERGTTAIDLGEHQRHLRFHARKTAVAGPDVFAGFFLGRVRRMVGGDHVDQALLERRPELRRMLRVADRRVHA